MAAIRVGMIGVGWGSIVQVPAFRVVPGFEVVALCSRRAESVEAAGAKLEVDDVSTDWEAFVRRDDLDLISVATPVDLHLPQVLAAIAAGKHVLVEKPVGLTAAETGEMLAAAEAAGVQHAVCFENRWAPTQLRLGELIRGGQLGDPYLVLARATADFWHPTRGLQSEWMYRLADGGGYLMGMGSHDIDFVCSLLGEPVAVCADVRTTVTKRTRDDGSVLDVDADDTSVVLLRMANGALVSITTSAITLAQDTRSFEAFGSAGSVSVSAPIMGEEAPAIRVGSAGAAPTEVGGVFREPASGLPIPARRAGGAIRSLALMLEEWLPAFGGAATPTVPTLRDGHLVARVVDAARASSAGAGWVTL
jgi:predicted dehydrogenase